MPTTRAQRDPTAESSTATRGGRGRSASKGVQEPAQETALANPVTPARNRRGRPRGSKAAPAGRFMSVPLATPARRQALIDMDHPSRNQSPSQQLQQESLSHTQHDHGQLVPSEKFATQLHDMYNLADQILKSLNAHNTDDDIEKFLGDSGTRPSFNFLAQALEAELSEIRHLTSDELGFVIEDLAKIVVFIGEPDPNSRVTLTGILSKINLAIFLLRLREWYKLGPQPGIKQLENVFPTPFVGSFRASRGVISQLETSTGFNDALELAIEIRTQVALMVFKEPTQQDVDLTEVLKEMFFEEEEDQYRTKTWAFARDIPDSCIEMINNRYTEMKSFIDSEHIDIVSIQYSWNRFLVRATQWIKGRNDEFNQAARGVGGIDMMINLLKGPRNARRAIAQAAMNQNGYSLYPVGAGSSYQTAVSAVNQAQTQSVFDNNLSYPQIDPQITNQPLGDVPASTKDSELSHDLGFTNPATQNKKRKRANDSSNVTDDQGFNKLLRMDHPLAALTDLTTGLAVSTTEVAEQALKNEEIKRHAVERGSQFKGVQDESKRKVALERAGQKMTQRNKWTNEETGMLMNYIETVGPSWAKIKAQDASEANILSKRDQVALKDKARNIKFDILKAGLPLPHKNFATISLSATMKERLNNMQISLEQRERDATALLEGAEPLQLMPQEVHDPELAVAHLDAEFHPEEGAELGAQTPVFEDPPPPHVTIGQ